MEKAVPKVIIAHVPYQHRGGEDVHVEMLERAYRSIGVEPILFPKRPVDYSFRDIASSLVSSKIEAEIDTLLNATSPAFFHLHNIFPILGPQFLRSLKNRQQKVVWTQHNHRFFCTNGLALRDGEICKECFSSPSLSRPILKNCNGDFKKTAYYALALRAIREEGLLKQAVHTFVAPSPYIASELSKFGIAHERIEQILNPVLFDTAQDESNRFSGSQDSVGVLYAGRLSFEKGVDILLKVAQELPSQQFTIAGSGPLEDRVQSAARDNRNIHYLGSCNRTEIRTLIQRASGSILPSLCNEILPTFVLESFFLGRHCIIPDLDSTRWLGVGEFPGIVTRTSDLTSVVEAVRRLPDAPPVGVETIEILRKTLGFSTFCEKLRNLYERVTQRD